VTVSTGKITFFNFNYKIHNRNAWITDRDGDTPTLFTAYMIEIHNYSWIKPLAINAR